MEFVLLKENGGRTEAHRSVGRRGLQRIVAQGISPELLRWKASRRKIAESPNSKVIVIGGGRTGCR